MTILPFPKGPFLPSCCLHISILPTLFIKCCCTALTQESLKRPFWELSNKNLQIMTLSDVKWKLCVCVCERECVSPSELVREVCVYACENVCLGWDVFLFLCLASGVCISVSYEWRVVCVCAYIYVSVCVCLCVCVCVKVDTDHFTCPLLFLFLSLTDMWRERGWSCSGKSTFLV